MALILGGLILLATLIYAWMAGAMIPRRSSVIVIPALLIGGSLAASIAATHWIGW